MPVIIIYFNRQITLQCMRREYVKVLIGTAGYHYYTLVDCSDEIGKQMHDYIAKYIGSDMHSANWDAEDLVRYIKREIRHDRNLYIDIIEYQTKNYKDLYPKIEI